MGKEVPIISRGVDGPLPITGKTFAFVVLTSPTNGPHRESIACPDIKGQARSCRWCILGSITDIHYARSDEAPVCYYALE